MSNPLTSVRSGVWSYLDADTDLNAFIDAGEGTRYRFADSVNLPVRLAAGDCPALIVEPVRGEVDWETTADQVILYRLEVIGCLYETAAAELEEFAYLAYAALAAGLPDFGVAEVEAVEFAGPAFSNYRKGGARFEEFRLGVAARIHEALPPGA